MRDLTTGFLSLPLLAGEGLGIGVNDLARALNTGNSALRFDQEHVKLRATTKEILIDLLRAIPYVSFFVEGIHAEIS